MKTLALLTLLTVLAIYSPKALASDDHKHDEQTEGEHNDEHDHDHNEEPSHADGDDHDKHEDESSSIIGSDKGITEKSEAGFKLSQEATQTMQIKSAPYPGGHFNFPTKALVQIKDEKSVFRIRDGWIKRVPVQVLQKNPDSLKISSPNFRADDQIVIEGAGFLRISEIFSEEGAAHGHSH